MEVRFNSTSQCTHRQGHLACYIFHRKETVYILTFTTLLAKTYYYFSCGPRFSCCPRIRWSILPMITRASLYDHLLCPVSWLFNLLKLLLMPHICVSSRLAPWGRRCFIILGSQRMRWFFALTSCSCFLDSIFLRKYGYHNIDMALPPPTPPSLIH